MISNKLIRGAVVVAAFALAAPALAQDDAKAGFQARYTELRTAMQAHDEAAIGAILTPDYAMTDVRGDTHTRADMLAGGGRMGGGRPGGPGAARADAAKPDAAKPADAARSERKIDQTVLSANVAGDVATVGQQLVMSGSREGDDGQPHTMEMTMLGTDTWVRQNGVWLLKASVQTDMTVKRDGDVVFHQAK